MNLLLDTHTLIWFFDGSDNLSDEATAEIEDPANGKFVSVASFWEIAIKISIGKLRMELSMENLIAQSLVEGIDIVSGDVVFDH